MIATKHTAKEAVIKHISMTVLLAVAAITYPMQCLAADQDWCPKATDSCAEFITKVSKPGGRFDTCTMDPAIAKWLSDFNAANVTSDIGAQPLIYLVDYCSSNGFRKLGDVTAQEVIAHEIAKYPPSKTQPGSVDTSAIENWYKRSLDMCGPNDECKRIAKKTYDDSIACSGGDTKTCSERDNNLMDIGRWNGGQRAAQATSQDPMMKCLQDTAASTQATCRKTNCDPRSLIYAIGYAQQIQCGYSAIEPIKAPALNPNPTCITNPTAIGGWITTCF